MEGMSGSPLDLLPELILVLGAVSALLLGLWTPQSRQVRAGAVAALAALGSAVASASTLGSGRVVYGGTWTVDDAAGVARLTITLATAAVIVLASSSLRGHPRQTEAYVLMLLGATGAMVLAAASDLLMLVAGYLLASVPLYALAGFRKDDRGVEATLKYYLMGAFAGVLMLLGVAALILSAGATDYANLAAALPAAPVPLVAVGVVGLLAGVGFKAGVVPVHFWVPDVTAGTTPAIAAFLTTIPKIGAAVAAFRLVRDPLSGIALDVPLVVAVIAAASMTLGNLAAFQQQEVLRLLGYSTVSQVGYLFMVVAVAARTDLAFPALAIYLAGYAVTNIGAFAAAAALPRARTLAQWAEASRGQPGLVLSLVVVLLGLVGTPPTAVFVAKLAVFSAAADGALGWLVVLAAVNTVASLFYYLRWFGPAVRRSSPSSSTRARRSLPLLTAHTAAVTSLVLGVGAGAWLTLVVA
ncbi:NADH-quinone oxidoreductase subunit N [Georgenia muralis]|uniref:NADH-quinone oxidoreductase subunit N n=1 Tax=Georgenia muralis TaxID=154117 RepID=A0A3N5A4I2_9MICO|nr:NADH-quinone oxidoreductase subunit N [Georgenia muralis]RPF28275.1 NADH-quinone oxidoreductase subunit N [Georgenia muralis]